jgi:hypothetical protein
MTSATSPADALPERLFGDMLGDLELFSVHLGAELGLYGPTARPSAARNDQGGDLSWPSR